LIRTFFFKRRWDFFQNIFVHRFERKHQALVFGLLHHAEAAVQVTLYSTSTTCPVE
jgi:predicted PurR-regulated permease PerM